MDALPCQKCRKPSYASGFCRKCFSEVIERRCRRAVHLSKGKTYVAKDPGVRFLLKRIIAMPCTVKASGNGIPISSHTADHFADAFIEGLLAGKLVPEERGIHPLRGITAEEWRRYLAIHASPLKPKAASPCMRTFAGELDADTLHGILRAKEKLHTLIRV